MLKSSMGLLLAMALSTQVGMAAQAGTPADETAIRQRLATYATARQARDAHAEALCYTEDGDFRSMPGRS